MLKKDKQGTYMEIKVDPYRGVAAIVGNLELPGYRFVSLVRKGKIAKIYFKKNDEEESLG